MSDFDNNSILTKANLVLNLILLALVLIAVRLWYLTIIQYDEKFEQSRRPQRKAVVEPAKRGTIRDRFNMPFAINKVAYRAGVAYAPMRQIPSTIFEKDAEGVKKKIYKRKQYIRDLSALLGRELHLDEKRVEDLIYSKAALYFNIPYIIKEEISETEYYRLKMLEKDWPGLVVQRYSKREYPKNRCACDVIGYMGAISREEYEGNIRELKALEEFLAAWERGEDVQLPDGFASHQDVRKRAKDLEELAYTSHDYVGKSGIEGLFEQELRGFQGRKSYYSDSRGNFLKPLPGARAPINGQRVLLSISQELQEYAESILAQNEDLRRAKSAAHGVVVSNEKQPWIKGSAAVVLDPNTGDVLAMASYPRYDPNDFITSSQSDIAQEKKGNISRWFESETHIAALWNQLRPLERERFDKTSGQFYEEERWIDWPMFLAILLPDKHPISQWFANFGTIKKTTQVLKAVDDIEALMGMPVRDIIRSASKADQEKLSSHALGKQLAFLQTPYTKLLFIDCCQLAVLHTAFSDPLLSKVGDQSIDTHRKAASAFVAIQDGVKQIIKELFHDLVFNRWRELNEKSFLKEKREIEKLTKAYPKPYIDYLDEKEAELFNRFWQATRYDLVLTLMTGKPASTKIFKPFQAHLMQLHKELESGAHPGLSWREAYHKLQTALKHLKLNESKAYLATLRSYQELIRPLKGKYKRLRKNDAPQLEKHLAAAFYPTYGYGYGRSSAYRQAATQGSIFKLVTAYEALMQVNQENIKKGRGVKNVNPLNVNDHVFKSGSQTFVGYNAAGKPIPQLYKGGRIPRTARGNKGGEMDLQTAIETSSNLYFSLLAGDVLKSPDDLADAARKFGYGSKTGIELPSEIPGRVPEDLATNRTGLYATAIGQHSLVVTPLQTAVMLASLANGGDLLKPQIVKLLAGVQPDRGVDWLQSNASTPNKALFTAIGLDFPLLDLSSHTYKRRTVHKNNRTVSSHVEMPAELRRFLLKSMHSVVLRTQATSLWTLSKVYSDYPEAISDYIDLKNHIVGKTSTSEAMERVDLDEEEGTNLYTHTWFGGIAFEDDVARSLDRPEVVVVVYLRFGTYGKEAAPLAAQLVNKWREIKARHQEK